MSDDTLFEWSESYRIGHDIIDGEHRYLFSVLKDFADAITTGDFNKYVLIHNLRALRDYTETHFSNEEELMLRINYEDYQQHRASHLYLSQQVRQLEEDFNNGKPVLTHETLKFLKDWLLKHILNDDIKLAQYINEQNIEKLFSVG